MKFASALLVGNALALVAAGGPAVAQSMPINMLGMTMPTPPQRTAKKKTAVKKNATAKKAGSNKPASKKAPAKAMPMEHGGMKMPPQPTPSGPSQMPMDHSQTQHGTMQTRGQMNMPTGEHAGHEMAMTGVLGRYPMERESSGTAWQPDSSKHMGLMTMSGDWTLMAHGAVNLVYDHQSGPRGDDKAFASGMLMGMARRPLRNGTVQLRASISPDPLMGPRGYPLVLASGETANGTDRLIDRQHPHDFFMEMSASVSQNVGPKSSLFLYAGLPGEPAFGPPAFMHRESIMDSPEAPITHHWLDSTHISFGVFTAGAVLDRVKLEVSRFNGREPDQHRWNIETGTLDSTAIRLSWNPTRTLALQGSWGHFKDPEQIEPGVDQKRWSASALYAREITPGWKFAGTLAWGRKIIDPHGQALSDDAFAAEASLNRGDWTIFGRGEITENRELVEGDEHGPAYLVGKFSAGFVRDFRIADHLSVGAGSLFSLNFVPNSLAASYGGSNPLGAMAFVRLRLN